PDAIHPTTAHDDPAHDDPTHHDSAHPPASHDDRAHHDSAHVQPRAALPATPAGEYEWWLSGVHLPGLGYVPPDVMQTLTTQLGTIISTAILDASNGVVASYVHRGYVPPKAMRAMVQTRDGRCRAFGCTLKAMRCDLDHANAYECEAAHAGDGATCGENLACLCRFHHRAKQHKDWTYLLDPTTSAAWWIHRRTGSRRTTLPDTGIASLGCRPPPGQQPRANHEDDRRDGGADGSGRGDGSGRADDAA
ncbi:MAG: hypothetical protein Q4G67_14405, partial [Actinomycetia bacterium]|nr:hypothetical protein [Actinomycetes bacterium]